MPIYTIDDVLSMLPSGSRQIKVEDMSSLGFDARDVQNAAKIKDPIWLLENGLVAVVRIPSGSYNDSQEGFDTWSWIAFFTSTFEVLPDIATLAKPFTDLMTGTNAERWSSVYEDWYTDAGRAKITARIIECEKDGEDFFGDRD